MSFRHGGYSSKEGLLKQAKHTSEGLTQEN
jgi:hypothetical protein